MAVTVSPRALGSIVVATDFSDGSKAAIGRAARLPLGPGATLDLLHVVPELQDSRAAERMSSSSNEALEQARLVLASALEADTSNRSDVIVSLARGKPFVEIVRFARHGRAELVVVGRHGRMTFQNMLIGSTAERVIRKGDVSVLVVAQVPSESYRRPLVAIDFSDSARRSLELLLRICKPPVERIDVIHVLPPYGDLYVGDGIALPGIEEARAEDEESARTRLADFLEAFGPSSTWRITVKSGDPRQAILEEARDRNSDLIALGTRGRTGLAHLLIGSVAEGVIRSARCDVVVARQPRVDFSLP